MPSAASNDAKPISKPTPTIPATAMPLISPSALLIAHLRQTPPTRPSSRSPRQPQRIDLNTGSLTHTNGSSVVKIGATTIVCSVRAEILPVSEIASYDPKTAALPTDKNTITSAPEQATPISLYNLVVPNLELSTGCSPLHPANTPPSTQAQSLSQRLYSLLLTSHLLRSSDLAITYRPPPETDADLNPDDPAYIPLVMEVKAFWVLYIDMMCISYGGEASVFDAAWLSLYAALRDTLLSRAWWDADVGAVLCDSLVKNGRRLELNGCPVPIGFAVVGEDGRNGERERRNWVLVDPDSFEEQCCDETGCVTVDLTDAGKAKRKIVRVEKSGGGVVGVQELREILEVADTRWTEWQEALKRMENERTKAG